MNYSMKRICGIGINNELEQKIRGCDIIDAGTQSNAIDKITVSNKNNSID